MTAAIPKKRTYRTLCPVTPCRSGMLATTAGGLPGAVSRWSPDFESSNCMHRSSADDALKNINHHCSEKVPVALPPWRGSQSWNHFSMSSWLGLSFTPFRVEMQQERRGARGKRGHECCRTSGRCRGPHLAYANAVGREECDGRHRPVDSAAGCIRRSPSRSSTPCRKARTSQVERAGNLLKAATP
jgi:hypothetical protein